MASRLGDAVETRWARIILLGVMVWLISLVFSYVLYWVDVFDHDYYIYATLGITLLTGLYCALRHLCAGVVDSRMEGFTLGIVWLIEIAAFNAAFLYFNAGDWLNYLIAESWFNAPLVVVTLLAGLYCHNRNRISSMNLGPSFRGPIGHR
jgi:hypothetical protein